jgi:hypothetical protein
MKSFIIWLRGKDEPVMKTGEIDLVNRIIRLVNEENNFAGFIPFESIEQVDIDTEDAVISESVEESSIGTNCDQPEEIILEEKVEEMIF